ncbi:RnfABCDGE type electron transport complex subunit D [Pseudodesulfovibrio senegalensis]|uniref:RnfABCDGE type electron transport complex subunit D n=1 Tax=Pseudodesulfovibrio senegalensis TaxID=1721087 RepID=A0A6N6MYF8_9BACT|nr:RnfABCDGE type electron transport complex subunit D [Pseudodesulfovibrio senegalensis]KAB1440296.1 RnfABCDGE type electron transport complex subunit D [Pseudodesulfovibrio senegalensis]
MEPLTPTLTVSTPPFAHCGKTVNKRMRAILLAMLPAAALAVYHFGMDAVRVMSLATATAVIAEFVSDMVMGRTSQVDDLHGFTVGLGFAFLLPASAPWWLVVFGSTTSIVLGKMMFGGLGGSPLCAPLVGWAVCSLSWANHMDIDAAMLTSELTYPLSQLKHFGPQAVAGFSLNDLLVGRQLGGLGAVQTGALFIGGIFLSMRKHIKVAVPVGMLAGVLVTAGIFHASNPQANAPAMFHLLTGSVIFGAFFLATDSSSSPMRKIPALLYGLLAGVLVVIIRVYGVYPDGVPYAILLANLTSPLLDRIKPKPFGRN